MYILETTAKFIRKVGSMNTNWAQSESPLSCSGWCFSIAVKKKQHIWELFFSAVHGKAGYHPTSFLSYEKKSHTRIVPLDIRC